MVIKYPKYTISGMTKSKRHTQPNFVVRVLLWDREVGRLFWDSSRGVSVFAYDKDYITDGSEVSPLDRPVRSPLAHIPFYGSSDRADLIKYNGLPPEFLQTRNLLFRVCTLSARQPADRGKRR